MGGSGGAGGGGGDAAIHVTAGAGMVLVDGSVGVGERLRRSCAAQRALVVTRRCLSDSGRHRLAPLQPPSNTQRLTTRYGSARPQGHAPVTRRDTDTSVEVHLPTPPLRTVLVPVDGTPQSEYVTLVPH